MKKSFNIRLEYIITPLVWVVLALTGHFTMLNAAFAAAGTYITLQACAQLLGRLLWKYAMKQHAMKRG